MNKLFAICLVILLFPGINIIKAQQTKTGKQAGIYTLSISLGNEFVEDYYANNKKNLVKGCSISILLPDTIIESIKSFAEDLCQKKLKADVNCIYKKNKKGEKVTTTGWGHVEGMPTNSFKGALGSTSLDYYIVIDVLIQTGGEAIYLGKGFTSKLTPWVIASIKVFDRGKNEVFTNKVSIKDFSDLRSDMVSKGVFDNSFSEVLGPVDLYKIYKITMNKLIVGGK